MELLGGVAAWVFRGLSTHSDYQVFPFNPLYENVAKCLGEKLSSASTIYTPGSAQFANATNRWTEWKAPNVTVVVQVSSEADIVSTVSRTALAGPLPGLFYGAQTEGCAGTMRNSEFNTFPYSRPWPWRN
jgi:hypothetical protein